MDVRILGLRSEYSVVFSAGGQQKLSPEEAGRRLFGPVASGAQATGVLLRNGGRLDLEAASRLAYATPEFSPPYRYGFREEFFPGEDFV